MHPSTEEEMQQLKTDFEALHINDDEMQHNLDNLMDTITQYNKESCKENDNNALLMSMK